MFIIIFWFENIKNKFKIFNLIYKYIKNNIL